MLYAVNVAALEFWAVNRMSVLHLAGIAHPISVGVQVGNM